MTNAYNSMNTMPLHSAPVSLRDRCQTGMISLWRAAIKGCRHLDFLLSQWQSRAEMRNQMRQLPAYILKDVGLTRDQVLAEANKPFCVN